LWRFPNLTTRGVAGAFAAALADAVGAGRVNGGVSSVESDSTSALALALNTSIAIAHAVMSFAGMGAMVRASRRGIAGTLES
jgi:hypothetical protein